MPKYSVEVSCELFEVYDIEADSQEEAEEIACAEFDAQYHPYEITHCETVLVEED